MKNLFLLVLVFSFNSFAFNREQAGRLLEQRQLSLRQLEGQGARLLLGEVTGAGFVIPQERVQVVFLRERAILRHEIESMDFSPFTGKMQDLASFRVHGSYYLKEDIKAVLLK
jgi:hypothetical protein